MNKKDMNKSIEIDIGCKTRPYLQDMYFTMYNMRNRIIPYNDRTYKGELRLEMQLSNELNSR